MAKPKPRTMDEYIAMFPENIRKILEELRRVTKETAPEAEETISYGMPTFDLYGKHLVFFAAYKNHIGFYPVTQSMVEALKKELTQYQTGKGTLQFPIDKPIPFDLVKKIVEIRVKENMPKK